MTSYLQMLSHVMRCGVCRSSNQSPGSCVKLRTFLIKIAGVPPYYARQKITRNVEQVILTDVKGTHIKTFQVTRKISRAIKYVLRLHEKTWKDFLYVITVK